MNRKTFIISILLIAALGWGIYDSFAKEEVTSPDGTAASAGGPSDSANEDAQQRASDVEVGLEVGDKAPPFELENMKGEAVKLSDYEGQKVILNFWASWCPPCRAEMPEMVDFYNEYHDDNVEILAVNLTKSDRMDDVEAFIEEFKLQFPVLLDKELAAGNAYQVRTIPTSLLLDESGIIRHKMIGPMTYDWMEEKINNM